MAELKSKGALDSSKVSRLAMEAAMIARLFKDAMESENPIVSHFVWDRDDGQKLDLGRPRPHPSFPSLQAAMKRLDERIGQWVCGDKSVPDRNAVARLELNGMPPLDFSMESFERAALAEDGALIVLVGSMKGMGREPMTLERTVRLRLFDRQGRPVGRREALVPIKEMIQIQKREREAQARRLGAQEQQLEQDPGHALAAEEQSQWAAAELPLVGLTEKTKLGASPEAQKTMKDALVAVGNHMGDALKKQPLQVVEAVSKKTRTVATATNFEVPSLARRVPSFDLDPAPSFFDSNLKPVSGQSEPILAPISDEIADLLGGHTNAELKSKVDLISKNVSELKILIGSAESVSSVAKAEPAAVVVEPAAVVAEPVAVVAEPVAVEPVVVIAEPVVVVAEPVVVVSEPVAVVAEPVVVVSEPVAVVAEPVVVVSEPVAVVAEPVAVVAEPVAAVEEPVAVVSEPVAVVAETVAVVAEPVDVVVEPVAAELVAVIVEPVAVAAEPMVVVADPVPVMVEPLVLEPVSPHDSGVSGKRAFQSQVRTQEASLSISPSFVKAVFPDLPQGTDELHVSVAKADLGHALELLGTLGAFELRIASRPDGSLSLGICVGRGEVPLLTDFVTRFSKGGVMIKRAPGILKST